MRDAVRGAKFVGQLIAAQTMASFQRARRIVQAGVDDAAIARACAHPDFWKRFENKDVTPAAGESAGDGAAHDATADNHYVGSFHGLQSSFRLASLFLPSCGTSAQDCTYGCENRGRSGDAEDGLGIRQRA